MKTKNILAATALISVLVSCSENDNEFLIPKGENNEVNIENSVYTHQTYYDLSSNKEVLSVDVSMWDLSVETSGSMQSIKLNPAKGYRVFKTLSNDITDEIILPDITDWTFDDPTYNPSKLAFYGWKDNEVYIIGKKSESFDPTTPSVAAYARVSFVKTDDGIKIQWVFSGESEVHEFTFSGTAESHPFTWFSFETGGKADVQPPSPADYDVIFTSYTGNIFDGTQSFIFDLHGTLTNRSYNVESYRYDPGEADDEEYINIFNDLINSDIDGTKFSIDADVIGYGWKHFSRTSMSYEIDKSNMYFIMDGNGNHYKIQFTNYYNDNGEKGYISFTYALL